MTRKDYRAIAEIVGAYEYAFSMTTQSAYDNALEVTERVLKASNENFDPEKFWEAVAEFEDAYRGDIDFDTE